MFLGFFQLFISLSIVPSTLSFLVSSRLAVTIHSMNSFLLVNESVLKNSNAFLFLSASVFARKPNTLHVSSKEIKLIQVSLSPSANKQSQPLSRLRSVCSFDVPFG